MSDLSKGRIAEIRLGDVQVYALRVKTVSMINLPSLGCFAPLTTLPPRNKGEQSTQ